jgi:hypothetical protein
MSTDQKVHRIGDKFEERRNIQDDQIGATRRQQRILARKELVIEVEIEALGEALTDGRTHTAELDGDRVNVRQRSTGELDNPHGPAVVHEDGTVEHFDHGDLVSEDERYDDVTPITGRRR